MIACSKCGRSEPHVSFSKNQRYCRSCQSEYRKAYWKANRESESSRHRSYYANNKEARKEAFVRWATENRDELLTKKRARYQAVKDIVAPRNRARVKEWRVANRAKKNAAESRREADKLRATPKWADMMRIQEFYELARRMTEATGYSWHVDHIVPLRSKIVCGLHCAHNLQVIPGKDNSSKGNRYWPDMPGQHENPLAKLRTAYREAGGVIQV
jgi:hypothetical protein